MARDTRMLAASAAALLASIGASRDAADEEPGTMAVVWSGDGTASLELHTVSPRRDWAVVLYSGECEEYPGLRCATQGFGPCTLAETDAVVAAVPDGFCAHRISLLDPGEFLGGLPEGAGLRGRRGDPTGDPPTGVDTQ